MEKKEKPDAHESTDTTETIQTLNSHIQERVNTGHEAPTTWLFKSLTILFHQRTPEDNADEHAYPTGTNTDAAEMNQHHRLRMARNTASFAGASIASPVDNPDTPPTHIVIHPSCPPAEVSSLRRWWATRGTKMPHLVTVEWIEKSWEERTVLDEERTYPAVVSFVGSQFNFGRLCRLRRFLDN